MAITSYFFIFIFFPIITVLYWIVNSRKLYSAGKIILLVSSLLFYGLLTPGIKGLIALLLIISVCYLLSTFGMRSSFSPALRKSVLAFGIVLNILFLIYCRYLAYIQSLLPADTGNSFVFEAIVVPIGISYFTFSQIAYMVDSYRDPDIRYSFLDYVLFVSFFPKITVGPIALTTEMIPQFNDIVRKQLNYDNMARGFYRFSLGLAKKLLIADNLGPFVDIGYKNIPNLSSGDALLVTLSYTLQLYFDFSGYCDLASGMCLMLGMDLCENFDGPYHSLSIYEFWKRWHISLTRFFRNYLYIPLGGNRKGKVRTYVNNMIIFLVSGLWHGAANHFIIWGALHGVGVIISRLVRPVTQKLPKIIRWLLTFSFVNFAWVFFRADDTAMALDMLKQVFTGGLGALNSGIVGASIPAEFQLFQWFVLKLAPGLTFYTGCGIWILLVAVALYFAALSKPSGQRCASFAPSRKALLVTVILFVWSVLSLSDVAEFIYVNF
ncbi:MAG: MBOAT family protein [Lachnospiraceae bacterium]|nr:MBOAT family protein [Lachnospiraceae bacterium]